MQRQADVATTFNPLQDVNPRSTFPDAGKRLSLPWLVLWATGGLAIGLAAQTLVRSGWPQQQQAGSQVAVALQVADGSAARTRPAGTAAMPQAPVRIHPVTGMPSARASDVLHAPRIFTSPAPATERLGSVDPAVLGADIVVDGEALSLDQGRVVLPTGTRFQVRLQADHTGSVLIHTVNPNGAVSPSPLWRSRIHAGQTLLSAPLRLEGARGLETMQIVLLGSHGQVLGHRQLQFWHL